MGWGDEGKWRWMARIAQMPGGDNSFGNHTLGTGWVDENKNNQRDEGELVPNVKGRDTVIYKLMTYGKERTLGSSPTVTLNNFVPETPDSYFSQTPGSPKTYGGAIPLVCVYTVNYKL